MKTDHKQFFITRLPGCIMTRDEIHDFNDALKRQPVARAIGYDPPPDQIDTLLADRSMFNYSVGMYRKRDLKQPRIVPGIIHSVAKPD